MSTTTTRTQSTVRAGARSVVWVANEITRFLLTLTNSYGKFRGCLVDTPELVPKGLMVWLAARHLEAVVLELLDRDHNLIRKFEMPIDYRVSDDVEELFESNAASLEQFLKRDRPGRITSYRVLCKMTVDDCIPVPGWSTGQLTDDAHLKRHELSSDLIASKHLRVGFAVFTGNFITSGDGT